MKKLYTIALVLISLSVISQTPGVINYQGVARLANGDPIVGTIGVSVTIHVGSAGGAATLTEQHSVNTNQFGIFEVRIGSNNPGALNAIAWGANSYWLGVAIDPAGGTNYGTEISNQRLLSVPYALYAEKSGSSSPGGSLTASPNVTVTSPGTNTFNINVPNYVAGNNVTITPLAGNNYEINAAGSTATSVPTGQWADAFGNVFLVTPTDKVGIGTNVPAAKLEVAANNTLGILVNSSVTGILAGTSSTDATQSAIYASNSGGPTGGTGITGVTSATGSPGVRGQNLGSGPGVYGVNANSANSAMAHGVYGESYSSNPTAAGVIGANNGAGPGVYGYQGTSGGGAGVWGIGNSSVSAAIHGINNNGYASVFGDNGNSSSSANAIGVWGRTNSSSNLASGVFGQNTNAGHGVSGSAVASNTAIAGVFGVNTGSGSGVIGLNNGTGHGVRGITNSSSVNIAGVAGFNNTAGSGVIGETIGSNTIAAGVIGINNGMGNGVIGVTSSSNTIINGVKGINNSVGAGVSGENLTASPLNSAHGVRGETNAAGTLAAGVFGMNSGAGHGVYGSANGAGAAVYGWRNLGTGPAARFDAFNNSEGVVAMVTGTGAAIHGNASGATSAVALWVDNGHIKASAGSTVAVTTVTFSASFTALTYTRTNCNDVKGIINIGTTSAGALLGDSFEFNVSFAKSYATPPTVVICGLGNELVVYSLKSIANTFFTVRVKTSQNLSSPQLAGMNMTYYVIE